MLKGFCKNYNLFFSHRLLNRFVFLESIEVFVMSFISCKNCKSVKKSEDRFCKVCGNRLEDAETISSSSESNKQPTFLCPICQHENLLESILCEDCGEDFGKYNIRANLSETSISRLAAAKEAMRSEIFQPSRSTVAVILRITCIVSGILFVIVSIISVLAINVWMLGLGSLVPTLFAFIFGIFWFSTTIGWILSRRKLKSYKRREY
ncbi:MAG: hypothetical protein HeimAB125_18080 [Candidatus Heimdallarchaeota archaeon AB_125]|nr:MAG: hypothetical protein HeimAB125_18080 [Candidatus Heimdallarchaeota archaeon AB_125]